MTNVPYSPESVSRRDTLLGVAWMFLAASCIGVVDGMAKYLAPSLHGVQVSWTYCCASLLCAGLFAMARGESLKRVVVSRRPWLQLARGASLACSLGALFVSLRYLPLAVATAVSFTAPLMIAALSGPVLGERVAGRVWQGVGLGIVGTLLVVRPGLEAFQWASLLTLLGALFFAGFNLATRALGSVDPPLTTVVYTFGASTLASSLVVPTVWVTPSSWQWGMFAVSGALGFIAHIGIAQSLRLAPASTVAPLHYVRLLWAIGIGIAVFRQWPDGWTLIGGALIVCAGLTVVPRRVMAS